MRRIKRPGQKTFPLPGDSRGRFVYRPFCACVFYMGVDVGEKKDSVSVYSPAKAARGAWDEAAAARRRPTAAQQARDWTRARRRITGPRRLRRLSSSGLFSWCVRLRESLPFLFHYLSFFSAFISCDSLFFCSCATPFALTVNAFCLLSSSCRVSLNQQEFSLWHFIIIPSSCHLLFIMPQCLQLWLSPRGF